MDKLLKNKKGFGIMEVLVAALVLGILYTAVLNLQTGNRETLIRIRGRDGAIEVAQQVIDEMNRMGIASIPDALNHPAELGTVDEATGNYTFKWDDFTNSTISRSWDRGVGGGKSTIQYTSTVTVSPTTDYTATNESNLEIVSHVYAKQVNVQVSWQFKGSTQSINMSTVIR